MRARPGERFSSEITLTPAVVGAYARAAGADNPVRHDVVFAASTRYGRPIASGTHTGRRQVAWGASGKPPAGTDFCWARTNV
jgi:acyl dehydratase